MELTIWGILILSLIVLIAGFIDSIAGGGGLLTVPAYLFLGIPPQETLGTNKLVSCMGTAAAVGNFIKNKKVVFKIILAGALFSVIGSIFGAEAILFFNQDTAGRIITLMLPLGLVAILIPRRNKTTDNPSFTKADIYIKTPLICFIMGFYDGFFGPGAGSFLAIGFYLFVKLDLIKATGNAKIFNLASNFGSLVAFMFAGKVVYSIALPLIASSMIGNYLGSVAAIKNGAGFIKVFLCSVLIMVFISLSVKYFYFK
ncbi:MAG: TSUP family transporter [Lentisphaerota bacterium]